MSDDRKRDRVRSLFRRHDKAAGPTSVQTSTIPQSLNADPTASTAATPGALVPTSKRILDSAIGSLSLKDRETIQSHLAHSTGDISAAVAQAHQAALVQKQVCKDKQWRWNLHNGHSVLLRDEANKVLSWLDRFKTIGDVVANVDPVHIGLPWAGIRVLLEITVSESRQMASLLLGLNLALAMANRLQVYLEHFLRLPSSLATNNFEEALVKMYSQVLQFLAIAIRTYQMSVRTRVWQAMWEDSILESFEIEIDKLGSRAEIEATNCDRQILAQNWNNARSWKSDLDAALRKLDDIQRLATSLASLHMKADLTKLAVAKGATYNSYVESHLPECLPGTRTQILKQIANWTNSSDGKPIFWLCGMAGTGKSTISRTVAHDLDEQGRLGASFFFKRSEADRGNAGLFFPTIIYQMVDRAPSLSNSVAAALASDSLLCTRSLQNQFEQLLLDPMLKLCNDGTHLPPVTIVIDALDECERSTDIRMLLNLLARLGSITSLDLHIFVTSRPELPIKLGFQHLNGDLHDDIVLEEVQASTIEHDIRAYFRHQLGVIKEEDRLTHPYDPLPLDWPGENNIETLVRLAVPLFIFAFTICLYVSESDPRKRLDTILQQRDHGSLSGLERTYQPILNQLIVHGGSKHDTTIADFQAVVGPIILLADPLSPTSLSSLLNISLRDIGSVLKNLNSVLSIPKDQEIPVRLLHLSFRDYLTEPQEKCNNPFWIDKTITHGSLAQQCLQRMDQTNGLRQDLCNVQKPGTRRADISSPQIADAITPSIAYACCYWVWHLVESKEVIHDNGQVHQFLQRHFLHWLEALSWLGKLSDAIGHLTDLKLLISVDQGLHLHGMLEDMRRFVLRYFYVIDLAPLQLYHSAIIFTPTQSVTRKLYYGHESHLLSRLPSVPIEWSSEIQTLEGHSDSANAVAFSLDGSLVASASTDRTVRLWSAFTGKEIQKLQGHSTRVVAVAFAPDGLLVASGSNDCTARIWRTTTGEEIQTLKGHEGAVNAVVFSPDGQIASASSDGTVRLWNLSTGHEMRNFVTSNVSWSLTRISRHVAFSPDGRIFVSFSDNDTIQLYDILEGKAMQKMENPRYWYTNVAGFAADGKKVALWSEWNSCGVKICDTLTGKVIQKLDMAGLRPIAVALSADGQVVASASSQNIIQQWEVSTGQEAKQELDVHRGNIGGVKSVTFSPNGQIIAAGLGDGTVRLWNASTTTMKLQKMLGHSGRVKEIRISQDGQNFVSTSNDGTVHLWKASSCEVTKVIKMIAEAVAFSPDGKAFALAYGTAVHLYGASTGELICNLGRDDRQSGPNKIHWARALVFSPDGQVVALQSSDRTVRLWNASTGEMVHRIDLSSEIYRINFTNNGTAIRMGIEHHDISLHVPHSEVTFPVTPSELTISGQWIQHQGQDLLWLPPEYRSKAWAIHANTVIIGQTSGAITLFEFREDLGGFLA